MSNDNWKLQASFRFGPNGTGLLNVKGDDVADLKQQLEAVAALDLYGDVATAGELLAAVANAAPLAQPQPAYQPAPGAAPPQTTAPAPGPAPAPAPTAPPTAAPQCPHGLRQYKSGAGAKGPWKAWMCPAQRDDPSKCSPEWIR